MAISVVIPPTAVSPGTTSIDTTGADFFWLVCCGYNSGFTAGIAPSVKLYGADDMGLLLNQTGGDYGTTTGSFLMYYLTGFTPGTANLTLTSGVGTFGQGPTYVYGALSGVVQSATATDVRRAPTVDSSSGTSISLAKSGLTAGDYLMYFGLDAGDNAHAPSGVNVEDLETMNNSQAVACGHFLATGTSHTGGWTGSGGGDMIGLVIPIIAATTTAYTLSATGTTYNWTTQAATLKHTSLLTAGSASYSWAVQDATLRYAHVMAAASATYDLAVQDASLRFDSLIGAGAASYDWTVQDATFTTTTVFLLSAEGATYSWAGEVATLTHDIDLQPGNRYYVKIKQRASGMWRLTEIIFLSVTDGFWNVKININGRWEDRVLFFPGTP